MTIDCRLLRRSLLSAALGAAVAAGASAVGSVFAWAAGSSQEWIASSDIDSARNAGAEMRRLAVAIWHVSEEDVVYERSANRARSPGSRSPAR